MKKLSVLFALILFFTTVSSSFAIDDNTQTTQGSQNFGSKIKDKITSFQNKGTRQVPVRSDADKVSDLKQRAEKEITRRLNFLNGLLKRVDSINKLSTADKTDLKSQIQDQINGLNTLQLKITADSDLTTLQADVKSIISDYYIFAFFRVKIDLLFAADRMSVAADRLTVISTKLQTRISEAQTAGKDVTAMNASLSDMNAKIADAKSQYDQAEALLKTLDAKGFPGNKNSLIDAKAKIKVGAQDLRTAYKDAISIKQALGDTIETDRKTETEQKTKLHIDNSPAEKTN